MLLKLGLFGALLSTTTTLASPVDHELVGIQCRCLSLSIQTTPSACTNLGFQNYNWSTAQSLASDHKLKLEFASQTTIDKVLSIALPLPTSVLETISYGEANVSPAKGKQTEDKMICGYGDEVRNMSRYERGEAASHEVAQIMAIFMLLIMVYVAGEYFWTQCQEGSIKLEGEERSFSSTVDVESMMPSSNQDSLVSIKEENFAAPSYSP